jgi:hypothetical protein
MRRGFLAAAAVLLVAAPASAQTDPRMLGPRTLTPNHVLCTDMPVPARPVPTLFVAGGHTADGRVAVATGESLVIHAGTAQGLAVGQRMVARRIQAAATFPKPGAGFGSIRTTGIVTLTAVGEDTSIAKVDFSCDPIEPGDFLEAYVQPELPSVAQPLGEPRFDDRATVLFGANRRQIFGGGDVMSVDRGSAQGLALGDRISLYRDRQNGLPLFHLGEALVVELAEQTSKVVILTVSDVVQAGDVAVVRRAP